MAFSSTVDSKPTTGVLAGVWKVMPGLSYVTGTWNAASVTTGTIDLTTYFTSILFACVNTRTGTGCTKWAYNYDGTPAAAAGKIGIIACTANDTGEYWAIGYKNP